MVKAEIRKILKIGSSLAVTLPKDVAIQHGLVEGSHVLLGNAHGQIIIEPFSKPLEIAQRNGRKHVALNVE